MGQEPLGLDQQAGLAMCFAGRGTEGTNTGEGGHVAETDGAALTQ